MARIYFGEANIINKKVVVPVYVNTEEENVNALDIKIKFSDNLIFRDWNDANSVINFWIEKPKTQTTADYTRTNADYSILQFSGVSIGGYIGRKGPLVNLIFEKTQTTADKTQTAAEKIILEILPYSKVLLNDGLGTEAKLAGESKALKISELKTTETFIDNYPPEPFKIYIYKNREIFDGKYFIVFQTTDKQSGIAYYEVAEKQEFTKPKINISKSLREFASDNEVRISSRKSSHKFASDKDLKFEKAESPYVLKDQTLRSYIFVKAVDKFGNERIEYLAPQNLFSFDEIFGLTIFLMIIIIIQRLIRKLLLIKRNKVD